MTVMAQMCKFYGYTPDEVRSMRSLDWRTLEVYMDEYKKARAKAYGSKK